MPQAVSAEQSVQVARALVTHDINMEGPNVDTLHVAAGEPFIVRFSYTIREVRTEEETWVFRLEASIENEDSAITEFAHKDRRIVRDAFISNLQQSHVCPAPGEYVLEFTATARIMVREWGVRTPFEMAEEEVVQGQIKIVVT